MLPSSAALLGTGRLAARVTQAPAGHTLPSTPAPVSSTQRGHGQRSCARLHRCCVAQPSGLLVDAGLDGGEVLGLTERWCLGQPPAVGGRLYLSAAHRRECAAGGQEEDEEDNLDWDEADPELPGPDEFDSVEEGPDQGRELAVAMARVASDTKATDVVVLHVAPLVYWTSYLVR